MQTVLTVVAPEHFARVGIWQPFRGPSQRGSKRHLLESLLDGLMQMAVAPEHFPRVGIWQLLRGPLQWGSKRRLVEHFLGGLKQTVLALELFRRVGMWQLSRGPSQRGSTRHLLEPLFTCWLLPGPAGLILGEAGSHESFQDALPRLTIFPPRLFGEHTL